METHLEQWLAKAEQSAHWVVDTADKGHGVCQSCGAEGVLFFIGTGDECGKCFIDTTEYWERREGCSSEIIFDGDPFPVDEFEWESPAHRQIVAHYIAVLAELVAIASGTCLREV